jgi:AcrR family transcriptional regulator
MKPDVDLREACVQEAFAIIGEVGIEGLSIREVARRLGVSHQAPYKHFPSAAHLLAEIVRRTFAEFSAHFHARHLTGDPKRDLHSLGEAYFKFAMERPLHYRLLFGTPLPDPAQHPEMMQEARAAFQILLDLTQRIPRDSAAPPHAAQLDALFIWSAIHGLATILQSDALQQIGLEGVLLEEALPHVLASIGKSLRP